MFANLGESRIWESEKQNLLSITINKHPKAM